MFSDSDIIKVNIVVIVIIEYKNFKFLTAVENNKKNKIVWETMEWSCKEAYPSPVLVLVCASNVTEWKDSSAGSRLLPLETKKKKWKIKQYENKIMISDI